MKNCSSFFKYLREHCKDLLRLDELERDIKRGLYFDSSIPKGFGLGSSGALCAAIYSNYKSSTKKESMIQLKGIFARMESYFHGSSSGMDPLLCYLGKPLLSLPEKIIPQVKMSLPKKGQAVFFLLNSKKTRKTETLVNIFRKKCQSSEFEIFLKNKLNPLTNQCIDLFLQGNYKELWKSFRELSSYQLEHLRPMIPKIFQPLWELGLKEKGFALKLCGAGGGGFILGMAEDAATVKNLLKEYNAEVILLS